MAKDHRIRVDLSVLSTNNLQLSKTFVVGIYPFHGQPRVGILRFLDPATTMVKNKLLTVTVKLALMEVQ
jgi:hypothetical protein